MKGNQFQYSMRTTVAWIGQHVVYGMIGGAIIVDLTHRRPRLKNYAMDNKHVQCIHPMRYLVIRVLAQINI